MPRPTGVSKFGGEIVAKHGARTSYFMPGNVYEAALKRLRWLYTEFDGKVSISNSGGKDSTVLLELCAIVAKELGYLPIRVMWLDQECEFQATVDYQRHLMYERDDVDFRWYQIPFMLENATNHDNPWLHVWGPGEEWVREKEPNSIHDNTYNAQHFYSVLNAIAMQDLDKTWCLLDGMRIEESPTRRMAMTSRPVYKWATWSSNDGTKTDPRYRFHPLYDWSYRDIWKAIYDHEWRYNTHYDFLFQKGIKVQNMRVSNYHHETALPSLSHLQEIEPETWERATKRLEGISTAGHIQDDQFPTKLPYMFTSWDEYCRYLIENLSKLPEHRAQFYDQYEMMQRACRHLPLDELAQWMILSVIRNDLYGTTINNFVSTRRTSRLTEAELAEHGLTPEDVRGKRKAPSKRKGADWGKAIDKQGTA